MEQIQDVDFFKSMVSNKQQNLLIVQFMRCEMIWRWIIFIDNCSVCIAWVK